MSVVDNEVVIQALIDQVFNAANVELLPELMVEDFNDHSAMPGVPPGREGYTGFILMLHSAFPDFHFELNDMLAEDHMVVIRGTLTGTNEGSLIGMPATSKKASWTAIHSFRLAGGKVIEHWGNVDMMGLMTQLGHISS